jgi:hypothetical protein
MGQHRSGILAGEVHGLAGTVSGLSADWLCDRIGQQLLSGRHVADGRRPVQHASADAALLAARFR